MKTSFKFADDLYRYVGNITRNYAIPILVSVFNIVPSSSYAGQERIVVDTKEKKVIERDVENDGVFDDRYVRRTVRDRNGNIVRTMSSDDFGADEIIEREGDVIRVYNEMGDCIVEISEEINEVSGRSREIRTFVYDNRQLLRQRTQVDDEDNGTVDSEMTVLYSRDNGYNCTTFEFDNDADGVVDRREVNRYYDSNLSETAVDEDGDGDIDQVIKTRWEGGSPKSTTEAFDE